MTLTERIENKRKEYEEVSAVDAERWKTFQEQEQRLITQFRNPWNEAYVRKLQLEKELAALETIQREMEESK